MLRLPEILVLVATVVGSIVVAALAGSRVITSEVDVAAAILGLLAAFAVYQLLANARLEEAATKLASPRLACREFNQREWYEELTAVAVRARDNIDITQHEPALPRNSGIEEKRRCFEALGDKLCNQHVLSRWLVAIDSLEKLDWVRQLLEVHGENYAFSLSFAHFDPHAVKRPISVQIIDRSVAFVIDLAKGYHSVSELDRDLVTDDPTLVEHLQRYYNQYWLRATPLKEGASIYWDRLRALEDELRRTGGRTI